MMSHRSSGRTGQVSDWLATVDNLMRLAQEANREFEYNRALEYLDALEDIIEAQGLPDLKADLRFELHRQKGQALTSLGKPDRAVEEYQKILVCCHDSTHLETKSETFAQIGQLLCKLGDFDRALGYVQRAIGAYRRLHDPLGTCKALRNLGVVYVELGEFEEARLNLEEAMVIAGETDDRILYADLVNNLGAVANMCGDWQQALERYRESLSIYEDSGERRKSGYAKNNIGITLCEREHYGEAHGVFTEAYQTAQEINDSSLELIVDINLADLYVKRGMLDEAVHHCSKAERELEAIGRSNSNLIEVKKIAGMIARRRRNHSEALEYFEEALELASQMGTQFHEAEVLLERGRLLRTMERHFESLADLERSYAIYRTMKADGRREATELVIRSIETLYLEVFNEIGAQVDRKDPYTKGHSDRVAALAMSLAREMGLGGSALKTIVVAALMHDIGKIRIDDAVLNKAGKLTEKEFRQIQKHPEYGVELIQGKEFPWNIRPLILHHHEHFDGSGYPLGLRGEDIPLGARIVCVADVFDALTSDRCYRKAFPTDKALEIMQEECGTTFDPVLLKPFVALVESGRLDDVVNSHTRHDEMFAIWEQIKQTDEEQRESVDDLPDPEEVSSPKLVPAATP